VLTWPFPQIPLLPDTPGRGRPVRLLDSAAGTLVDSTLPGGTRAGLYVCGVTPYDATHIGHAATYVAFDLLDRAWRDAGLEVVHASNVTDVDDPLLERAHATGVDWQELAREQEALFAEDMTALGVIPPSTYLGAVETLPQVAAAVADLLERGLAYRVPLEDGAGGAEPALGDVYADLSADPRFGTVSGLDGEEMRALFAERGGDPQRQGKRHPLDPLLWRRERHGEPSWEAGVLGTGRPGWHIECAVIARRGIGADFDVLGGGRDLVFPHHEMSTSHARLLDGADGTPGGDGRGRGEGARVHAHAGLVAYQGEKMSKSLGNLVFVSALRDQGVDPMAIRLALLAHRYREDWEWHDHDLVRAQARLAAWRDAVSGHGGPAALGTVDAIRRALADDLDAPAALAAVDAWVERSRGGPSTARVTDAEQTGAADWDEGAAGVVARAVNTLLGIRL